MIKQKYTVLPRDVYFALFDSLVERSGETLDYASAARLGRTCKASRIAWIQFALQRVPLQLMRFYRGMSLRNASYVDRDVLSLHQSWLPRPLDHASDEQCIDDTVSIFGVPMMTDECTQLFSSCVISKSIVCQQQQQQVSNYDINTHTSGIGRYISIPRQFFISTGEFNDGDAMCSTSFTHGQRIISLAIQLLKHCSNNISLESAVYAGVPSALVAVLALYVRHIVTYTASDEMLEYDQGVRNAIHLLCAVASPFFALRENVMLRRARDHRYPKYTRDSVAPLYYYDYNRISWETRQDINIPLCISTHTAVKYLAYCGGINDDDGCTDLKPLSTTIREIYNSYMSYEMYATGLDARIVREVGGRQRTVGMGRFNSTTFDCQHPFFTTLFSWCSMSARGSQHAVELIDARIDLGDTYKLHAFYEIETDGVVLYVVGNNDKSRQYCRTNHLVRIAWISRKRHTRNFTVAWTSRSLQLETQFIGSIRTRILQFVLRVLHHHINNVITSLKEHTCCSSDEEFRRIIKRARITAT